MPAQKSKLTFNGSFPYEESYASKFYKLFLPHDDRPHGYMLPSIVDKMPWTSDFVVDHQAHTVKLQDSSNGQDPSNACNAVFAKLIDAAIDQDLFLLLHGQHSEPYRIVGAKYPVSLERYTAPLFGIVSRGAHLTVYTRTSSGLKIWVPVRSANVHTYPNMLDTTVAGGVRADQSAFECVVQEADEEASLPDDLVRRKAKACGVLTYMSETTRTGQGIDAETGLASPDAIYVHDLEVGPEVMPRPHDDEVKEFNLMGVDEIKEAMFRGDFKANCALVMIDFFIRHGIITATEETEYVDIIVGIHRRLPFPIAS